MRIEAKKDWEEAKRFNVLQLRLMKKCVDQIKKKQTTAYWKKMKSKKIKQNSFCNLFFPVLTQQQL